MIRRRSSGRGLADRGLRRLGGGGFDRVAEQILDFKRGSLDGDLLNWSPADLDEVLFGLYPAKVLLDAEAIAEVPPGFASFLRFLAGRRPEHSPPFEVLAEYVELSASRFISAMNDEDNWSFGKRMWSTAVAEGVDLSDEDAIGRWMEDFNSRTLGERDQILGRLPAPGDGLLRAVFGSMPPVVLAPEDELRALAMETVLVRRLTALVRYVGAGRAVTDRGNLKLADGKELVAVLGTDDRFDEQIGDQVFKTKSSEELSDVDWTYRIALETLMLEIGGTKLLPGSNVDWVDTPLDAVYGALLVMVQRVGPTQYRYRKDHYGFGWYADELDSQLSPLLLELYRDRRGTGGRRARRDDVGGTAGPVRPVRGSSPQQARAPPQPGRERAAACSGSSRGTRDRRDRRRGPHRRQVRRCRPPPPRRCGWLRSACGRYSGWRRN